jgi:hypothetical protein
MKLAEYNSCKSELTSLSRLLLSLVQFSEKQLDASVGSHTSLTIIVFALLNVRVTYVSVLSLFLSAIS